MSRIKKTLLCPDDEAEICRRRFEKNAAPVLAKHYGIAQERVRRIWKSHFGGTTLRDADDFVKRNGGVASPPSPSPEKSQAAAPPPSPKVRTAGKFVVAEPSVAMASGAVAAGAPGAGSPAEGPTAGE